MTSHQSSARTNSVTVAKIRRSLPPASANPSGLNDLAEIGDVLSKGEQILPPHLPGKYEVKDNHLDGGETGDADHDDPVLVERPDDVAQNAPDVTTPRLKSGGNERDARMAKIEEILGHADMRRLEKCERIAEWVQLAEAQHWVSGQVDRKPGRPEGGIARASRELPLRGSLGARRKNVERAIKINTIFPEAKVEVRKARLDDNQTALLDIANELSLASQLAKVREIAERKAMLRRKSADRQAKGSPQEADTQPREAIGPIGASENGNAGSIDGEPSESARQEASALRTMWEVESLLQRDAWERTSAEGCRLFLSDVLCKEKAV